MEWRTLDSKEFLNFSIFQSVCVPPTLVNDHRDNGAGQALFHTIHSTAESLVIKSKKRFAIGSQTVFYLYLTSFLITNRYISKMPKVMIPQKQQAASPTV